MNNLSYITMKSFYILLLVFCAFPLISTQGQTTIYTQDFETENNGYSASTTSGSGFTDVFNRSNPNIGGNSTFIWALEDTDSTPATITLDEIDVTGYADFTFSIDLLAHHYQDWDQSDEMNITYSIDGGAFQNLMSVRMHQGSGDASNGPAAIDTNFDGFGDCGVTTTLPALSTGTQHGCTVSNDEFENFASSTITLSSNTTLHIKIDFVNLTADDEGIYLDNIQVVANSSVAGPCAITNLNLANISCNDNGTPTDGTDDVTSFTLNPTGTNLGLSYTVDMDGFVNISTSVSGPFTSYTATANYGSETTFYLEPGSAGIGADLDALVIDDTDTNCFDIATITDPENCISNPSDIFEDFNDGDFTADPIWTGDTGDFAILTDATIPNGNASTDGLYLGSNASTGQISLAVESNEVSVWQFSLATPDFNPSDSNFFGVVLMASNSFSGNIISSNFQGYYLRIGVDGSTDPMELWRKTGTGRVKVGDFPSSPNFGSGALQDGLNIRVTRSATGEFELFYSTGFDFNTQPTTSAGTITNNTYNTSNYFGVYQSFANTSNSRRVYIDNIELGDPTIDNDSQVTAPTTQSPSTTLIADVATSVSNAVEVFKFNIVDTGTSDGVSTEVTTLRLVPGSSNTALWSQTIEGISLVSSGAGGILSQANQSLSITDSEIIVQILDNSGTEMTIPDGVSQEYTLSVFLKSSGIIDEQVLQFAIDTDTSNWEVATNSSDFESSFTAFQGNTHTISVVGQNYAFISQPINANINSSMPTDVQIAFVDVNNNADKTFTEQVQITSSGTLNTSPLTATPVDGIASFSGNTIIHSLEQVGVTLTATSSAAGFPATLVSNSFDIISAPELFISEVVHPRDDASGKYVEIFNAGITAIDFDTQNYFVTREANGGVTYEINQLTGTLPAKGYYIISEYDNADFNTTYNTDTNIDAFILGNGNDTYILSTAGANETEAINTQFDVYGEIGINGFTGTASTLSDNTDGTANDTEWEYEDSRAYRLNPEVRFANNIWTNTEWVVDTDGADVADMTPGYGDNDYIYDGDWTTTGLGVNPDGISTTSQNIFVKSGTVTLNNSTSVGDVVVRSGAVLILEKNVKLTVAGDIVNEGTIIFKSEASDTDVNEPQSAVLEATQPNTRVLGNAFEIHRYIPNTNRSFRYLAPSVTTTTSIRDNWQEGQNNTSTTAISNTNDGFGTHITGSMSGANGFDATETGNASMYTWNTTNQAWDAIPNTNSKLLNVGEAYAILIRGDRDADLSSNTSLSDPTILRTTGTIHVGDYNVDSSQLSPSTNTNGAFSLVTNPYQSQVDLKDLLDNHSTDINTNTVYIYDASIGTIGGYATIDLANLNYTSVPSGTTANQYLQPNQAFVVEATGSSPSISFEESVKNNNTSQVGTFSSQNTLVLPTFADINIHKESGELLDGVRIMLSDDFSSSIDNLDARKAWNFNESISVFSNNDHLSVEKRNIPVESDTTHLHVYNYKEAFYSIKAKLNTTEALDYKLYLVDKYTQNTIALTPNQDNTYNFNIDNEIPESYAVDRFLIVYNQTNLSLQDVIINDYSIYPNPVSLHESIQINGKISEIDRVEVWTVHGQVLNVIQNIQDKAHNNAIDLNMNFLQSKGLYLLQIHSKKGVSVHKLFFDN